MAQRCGNTILGVYFNWLPASFSLQNSFCAASLLIERTSNHFSGVLTIFPTLFRGAHVALVGLRSGSGPCDTGTRMRRNFTCLTKQQKLCWKLLKTCRRIFQTNSLVSEHLEWSRKMGKYHTLRLCFDTFWKLKIAWRTQKTLNGKVGHVSGSI